jgi:hypothetical protein
MGLFRHFYSPHLEPNGTAAPTTPHGRRRWRIASATALLGLLAIAGYQNRDKLAEMLNSRSQQGGPGGGPGFPLGGLLGNRRR